MCVCVCVCVCLRARACARKFARCFTQRRDGFSMLRITDFFWSIRGCGGLIGYFFFVEVLLQQPQIQCFLQSAGVIIVPEMRWGSNAACSCIKSIETDAGCNAQGALSV